MPLSLGALQQKQEQDDKTHHDAHKRLRQDLESLERRVTSQEAAQVANGVRFTKIESTPLDVGNISFTTRTVIAIVIAAVGLASAQWALNANLRSDVLAAIQANSKFQDDRATIQQKSIDDMRKEFRLLQMSVTDYMINGKRAKPTTDRSQP